MPGEDSFIMEDITLSTACRVSCSFKHKLNKSAHVLKKIGLNDNASKTINCQRCNWKE